MCSVDSNHSVPAPEADLDHGERTAVSIVVPAHNEQEAVAGTLESLLGATDALGGETEIIVVDDGSEDGTEAALEKVTGACIIRHPERRGYGASLKTGIAQARHPWIVIVDADGTYPCERIPDLVAHAREHRLDMVVGARTPTAANVPLLRRPAKWALGKLANFVSGRDIPDLNSGLRVMRRSVVERFLGILPDGFSFTTTITLAMLTKGMAVGYVPIEYRRRSGRSKIRPVYDTLNFLQLICRAVLWFNPLRVFIPLSLAMFVAAFAVLVGSWWCFGRATDVTFGVLIMTGAMVLAVGMLADMIDKRMP